LIYATTITGTCLSGKPDLIVGKSLQGRCVEWVEIIRQGKEEVSKGIKGKGATPIDAFQIFSYFSLT
jgi:hypothetical protein